MKKFTDIGQFNQVIRDVKITTDYKGKDENGDAIYVHDTEYPTLRFRGTVKCHGSNAGILLTKEGNYIFQSRERELSLGQDNAGFMTALSGKNYKKLFEGIEFNDHCCIYGEWVGCFPYKTPILLANGEKMAIGTIVKQKLDVEVMSYNQTTGKLEAKKIIGWHNNGETDDWLKINIQRRKRGGKSTGLVVTPNHKIFLKEDNKLIEKFASELKIGDKVLIAGDQSLVEANIESIENYTPKENHKKTKYDITVEDNHNYFANNTLVHNSGVQGKVALAQLSKRFIIFAVRIDDVYQDMENYKHLQDNDNDIYNILQFPYFYIDIDFNRPELSQNELVEKTLAIEEECPVGKFFGISGIGEGTVLEAFDSNGKRYCMKSKGLKHANGSKVKTMRVVDEDKINALLDLADEVTPVWRLDQMLVQACDLMNGGFIERKHMGEYMKLIMADVLKEETDKIVESGYEFKDLTKYISEIAKKYFFDQEINRDK